MKYPTIPLAALTLTLVLATACGGSDGAHEHGPPSEQAATGEPHDHEHGGDEHAHDADDHEHAEEGHEHAEAPLGTVDLDGLAVQLAQGHGGVTAGKESHLVVKLPYSDSGATVVRAWLGTGDRTLSYVGKGEYAPDHDDYDIHATAPDPLPDHPLWWFEIEQPDGTRRVGSAEPLME